MRNRDGAKTPQWPDSLVVPAKCTNLNHYALPRNMRWVEKADTYISRNTTHNPDMARPMGAILYMPMNPFKWGELHPENWFNVTY